MKFKLFIFLLFFIFYKNLAYGDIIQDSKIWKFFAKIANDAVTNFPEIPVLKSELEQGILKFGSATYVGQIKGGKAHGTGVFIFSDGSKYEGNFKRNMFHGDGIYKDENGNSYDGKWKYNKLHQQIDKKTREEEEEQEKEEIEEENFEICVSEEQEQHSEREDSS